MIYHCEDHTCNYWDEGEKLPERCPQCGRKLLRANEADMTGDDWTALGNTLWDAEEITDGAISSKAMGMGLSLGVAVSLGLAMVRVLTGISILWFLIPGYAIALGISFFVPKIYTAIAFDSGGVASGPMTAAFLLPMAQGACSALGGNIVTDAFGVVAMVAMTPLITIQVMGLASRIRAKRGVQEGMSAAHGQSGAYAAFELLDDDAIIEL